MPLLTLHTADLSAAQLAEVRALLHAAFDDLEEDDVEHALGGLHVLAVEEGHLVGTGSVVMRRLLHGGRALRCGYVEAVAVREDRRRRGVGGAVMDELERVVRGAYEVGALGSTDEGLPFYTGRGWQVWRGSLSALTPGGVVPTPDEAGAVLVLPVDPPAGAALDLDGDLCADWRDGDVW